MSRTTYLRDDELGWITKEEWEERNGKVQMRPSGVKGLESSIEAFQSPIDGSIIRDRSQLREHNKKHGVTNIADYSEGYFEQKGVELAKKARGDTPEDKLERKKALDKTLTEMGV